MDTDLLVQSKVLVADGPEERGLARCVQFSGPQALVDFSKHSLGDQRKRKLVNLREFKPLEVSKLSAALQLIVEVVRVGEEETGIEPFWTPRWCDCPAKKVQGSEVGAELSLLEGVPSSLSARRERFAAALTD